MKNSKISGRWMASWVVFGVFFIGFAGSTHTAQGARFGVQSSGGESRAGNGSGGGSGAAANATANPCAGGAVVAGCSSVQLDNYNRSVNPANRAVANKRRNIKWRH